MRVLLSVGLYLICCVFLKAYSSDSIRVIVVCERSFDGEVLIGVEGKSMMTSRSFKDVQVHEISLKVQHQPFNIEVWEKRRLFFGHRKYRLPINVLREDEQLVLDRSSMVKRRYRYHWYWVKDKREIRTVINED